jgi:hypothetical protein
MNQQSFMDRFGARLVLNGYPIIPIQPGTKKPGCHRGGGWRDYPDSNRHAARATTDLELAQWRGWPDAGIGIVGGAVAGVDIDIADDAELAHRIERLARERLGDTPALRIGCPPKRLLVYRTMAPFKGVKRHPLEVLCLGQQFVAYAVHPTTGRPYDWPEDNLADLDLGSLPAIEEAQSRAFLDEAIALLPEQLQPARLPAGEARAGHAQQSTPEAVCAALAWIPNADLDYDSWVRIGMAIKGAIGDAGADLFAAWSAQSAKNDPAVTARTWAGFKPKSIGAGTLYHHAMARGWTPDAALVLDGSAPRDAIHPAARLLASIGAGPAAAESRLAAPAFDLVIPGGVLGDLTRYMTETARRPQLLLSLGASLCAVGALMGRKYRTDSNLRSNLYIVGIADSGSGKNHGREIVNELFVDREAKDTGDGGHIERARLPLLHHRRRRGDGTVHHQQRAKQSRDNEPGADAAWVVQQRWVQQRHPAAGRGARPALNRGQNLRGLSSLVVVRQNALYVALTNGRRIRVHGVQEHLYCYGPALL